MHKSIILTKAADNLMFRDYRFCPEIFKKSFRRCGAAEKSNVDRAMSSPIHLRLARSAAFLRHGGVPPHPDGG